MAVAFLFVLIMPLGSSAGPEKMKVAFVEFATAEGSSWVRANVEGARFLQKAVPWVEVKVVESVAEGPGVLAVLRQLAREGTRVIFANAFGYGEFTLQVAKEFPSAIFINQQAVVQAANVGSYYGRLEEGRYLTGIVAGLTTKVDKIGFVGAHPIPPVISGINAFALGVQAINPRATVVVTWVNSWYDPPKEKEAAEAVLAQGVDIVANHLDSPATLQAAANKGKYGMTSNADWSKAAPDYFLTGTVWNWGPFYKLTVERIRAGTWKPGRYIGSFKDGVVALAPFGPAVTAATRKKVEEIRTEIVVGRRHIFQGPIYDQQGMLRVPSGKTLSDADLNNMNWLVRGVQGTVK
jgi:basic membrane protein A